MLIGWLHQEDITIMNEYASNTRVPKCIKQILIKLKEEIRHEYLNCKRVQCPTFYNV